jgi:hypothetical protein
MQNKKSIPLPKALFILLITTTVLSGGTYIGLQALMQQRRAKMRDPKLKLTTLIQTGPQKEALSSSYLAELLGLSRDRPTSSVQFNLMRAKEMLLRSPVIKEADVKLLSPQTLYVNYTVRQPQALLFDVPNGALDEEGTLFPLSPFFAPKKLPEIYLGLITTHQLSWNHKIEHPSLVLGLNVLRLLSLPPFCELFTVQRIDVSQAAHKSYGRRQLVLLIEESFAEEKKRKIFLRLTPKNYAQELGNYLELRQDLAKSPKDTAQPTVVDLRISNLAFIK